MNERIRELVNKAIGDVDYIRNDDDLDRELAKMYIPDCFAEKFAGLIIDDVLAILADSKNFNKCTYTTFDLSKGQCITIELAKKIKEHFGNKQ